jgi:hypothetical protein
VHTPPKQQLDLDNGGQHTMQGYTYSKALREGTGQFAAKERRPVLRKSPARSSCMGRGKRDRVAELFESANMMTLNASGIELVTLRIG